jgi:hypothetical protein
MAREDTSQGAVSLALSYSQQGTRRPGTIASLILAPQDWIYLFTLMRNGFKIGSGESINASLTPFIKFTLHISHNMIKLPIQLSIDLL